jgi:UDP-N-acetylmuramate dehydrogenase
MMSSLHNLAYDIPLVDKNWFRTGGNARFYIEPSTSEEFEKAVRYAHEQNLEIFILGEGANMLVADCGFDGLVIRPRLTGITHVDLNEVYALVTAGAGVAFKDVIVYCLQNFMSGLEEFSGIPGTIGGCVFINIHFFEFLLSQFFVSGLVIEKVTGISYHADAAWFNFGYNTSRLHDEKYYLMEATFKVRKVAALEASYARGRHDEIIRYRKNRYPNSHTCGSFFRNFFDYEAVIESNGKKMIYVAYYLDALGFKGKLSRGGAIVSYQHANMIVNKGSATSHDIVELAVTMQQMVYDKFGIIPQPECRFVGFKSYPLL